MIARLRPIALVLAFATAAIGQAVAQTPDRRGEIVLDEPAYRGVTASAPIPPEMHLLNEGGSDGLGLCVVATAIINGIYQGVPGLELPGRDERSGQMVPGKGSAIWRAAKSRPGGYSPQKLERLLDELMPEEKWAEYVGTDPAILDKLSRLGYAIGATMNTGGFYDYRSIHHMVSLIHYRLGGYACVVDNNNPGKYHWMPAREFDRRWIDGGIGWAHVWTRLENQAREVSQEDANAAALFLFAAGLLLLSRRHLQRLAPAVAAGMVFFAMGISAPQSAHAQYVIYTQPQPQPQPAMAWYDTVINGQPTKVWGWFGADGQIHYYPHMQPARPQAKAQPKPAPKPPKPPKPEPKGLLNGVDIQGLKESKEQSRNFLTNDPDFWGEILHEERLPGQKVPLPIDRDRDRDREPLPLPTVKIPPWAYWLFGAVIIAAIFLGALAAFIKRD